GSGGAVADGGGAGTSGASGEDGGAGGAAGGGGLWGPNGPKKQFSCPPPPYPTQMMGASTDVCVGKMNYNWAEGPTSIASEGAFFFSSFPEGQPTGGDILKVTPGGTCDVWLHDVACNGLGVSPSGNLLGACQGPRAIMEYDVKTKAGRKIATMV